MLKLNTNQPLLAKFIYLKGDEAPMKNRLIWITDRFIITAKNQNDICPTWYNIDMIDRMLGVEALPPEKKKDQNELRISF